MIRTEHKVGESIPDETYSRTCYGLVGPRGQIEDLGHVSVEYARTLEGHGWTVIERLETVTETSTPWVVAVRLGNDNA